MMTNTEKSALQREIVDYVGPKPHGRLVLAPRVGKTKLIIDIIKKDKPNSILWVTISSELAEKVILQEFDTWKAKRFISKLTTCTYASLHNMEGHFDMIILDEDQHLTENNAINLLEGCLEYDNIIAMTGTSTKHRDKIKLYTDLKLGLLYELPINKAVDINLLADYRIRVLKIDPVKEKMKKYNQTQYLIDRNKKGYVKISDDKTNIQITGSLEAKLTIQKGESKYGGEFFYVFGKLGKIGYVVITEEGILKGKLTNGSTQLQITDGVLHLPQPAYLLISRSKNLGSSELKTEVAKHLLSKLEGRKLTFSTNIEQAQKISNNVYHSKSSNEFLLKFQAKEIDDIVMVNKGGTGFTYKNIDHLLIIQCDSDKNGLTSQKICRTLLSQEDYAANVWLLCVKGTRDEFWVESVLESFDKSKVKYVEFNNL